MDTVVCVMLLICVAALTCMMFTVAIVLVSKGIRDVRDYWNL